MMHCLSWIRDLRKLLFCRSNSRTSISSLPDDTIVDILSRLPAESVVACRLVCSSWRRLSSTTHFAEIHVMRASPILVAQYRISPLMPNDKVPLFSAEVIGKKVRLNKVCIERTNVTGFRYTPKLLTSLDGFLIFDSSVTPNNYVIYNPVTQEKITHSLTSTGGCITAFFFHPVKKEYNLLQYGFKRKTEKTEKTVYFWLYSLGTKENRELGPQPYFPLHYSDRPGVASCGSLLWVVGRFDKFGDVEQCRCSETIMKFDMKSESFNALPHPGASCKSSRELHYNMQLLDTNGKLFFFKICANIVEVWSLEDFEEWIWMKTYALRLGQNFNCGLGYSWEKPLVLDIQSYRLLLHWPHEGLFWCNLERNTSRKIKASHIPKTSTLQCAKYTRSFVFLRRCSSGTDL